MNLTGRKFQNKAGKVCIVKDFNDDFTIFADNSRVETKYLLDKRYFVEIPNEFQQMNKQQPQTNFSKQNEKMDPSTFFQKSNSLFEKNFLSQLNNAIGVLPEAVNYDNYETPNNYGGDIQVMQSDPELEKDEIARKYGLTNTNVVINRDNLVSKQANSFMEDPKIAKMLEEEGQLPPVSMRQPQVQQPVQNLRETLVQTIPESRSVVSMSDTVIEKNPNINYTQNDPILSMFKKAKRNTNFKISFDIEQKIPRLDFIEMMEDSYETSIIDYLAQEFTDNIISNPSFIKDKIVAKLTAMLQATQTKKDEIIPKKEIEVKKPQIPTPKAKKTKTKEVEIKNITE